MPSAEHPVVHHDVRAMFDRIAGRYRLMNAVMTFGRDRAWRRAVVKDAALPPGGRLLDLASGTGDIALEALRQATGARVTAVDFSLEMMRVAGGGRAAAASPGAPPTLSRSRSPTPLSTP